jgi:hypothetical protein
MVGHTTLLILIIRNKIELKGGRMVGLKAAAALDPKVRAPRV